MRKVSVIGGGFTGSTATLLLAQKELVNEVVLVDIPDMESKTQGKALDMFQSSAVQGFDTKVSGTSNYEDTKGSEIVIITAGMARKPGMSRDDLVAINSKIMTSITKEVVKYSPACKIIVLTNPVDAMTYTVYKESGFPKNRVIGQSGVLDTARFCTFVADELGLSVKDISSLVLGGHGDEMVPLLRHSYAGGVPLNELISEERLDQIVERTKTGGAEIVKLLGDGSAYYAPAAALVDMAEIMLKNQRRIVPSIAYLEGEYGYSDVCLGVPTIISNEGIEKVIELALTADEMAALDYSVAAVRKTLEFLK